nr:lactate utilization protein C [uncultured Friedmanniella sp.]
MSAREEILDRIRAAHLAAPPPDLPYEGLSRDYRVTSDLDEAALVERLVDRLLDYKALVRRCRAGELPGTIAAALRERGVRGIVVPAGLEADWLSALPQQVAVRQDGAVPEARLSVAELDGLDGVLSACAVAVAETGTLVLDGGAGQGRRVISLIPDYHLCVVLPDQVCADVPQAVRRLDLTRPTTMISGPSATSDIELNRVEGVHGPRTLEVVVVER